ncbi:Hsp70 family protein [Dactylosporangium sucinum]|uniref:Uncharacterized protein n=1 Tax=Dactylosporangium sucinum TaxID=1424081 RepID=A0A917TTP4_9ACTN|nr:hypothetical protein [Dactylosporangium sucinum]GGM37104.1 hypothetical protein GCM10007977_043170 [Dactylosporangium sucinum]
MALPLVNAKYVVGLDLGDGESTIAWRAVDGSGPVEVFRRRNGEVRVLSALGTRPPTGRVIGVDAVATPGVLHFSVSFKQRPPGKQVMSPPYVVFARTLLNEFFARHPAIRSECVVYIGHPSGWPDHAVQLYREHLDELGDKGGRIEVVSEAHSALVHAADRSGRLPRHDRTVLVVDIGSSTTDLTVVAGGEPSNLPLGTDLGGAAIDRAIAAVLRVRAAGPEFDRALASDGGEDFLRLVARRIKEGSPNDLFGCDPRWRPLLDGSLRVARRLDLRPFLDEWAGRFRELLWQARQQYVHTPPDQIILTGGGSRLPFVRSVCAAIFPKARIDNDPEPQLSVARGLVVNGRYRVRVARFRSDVGAIVAGKELAATLEQEVDDAFEAIRAALLAQAQTDRDVLVHAFLFGVSAEELPSAADYSRSLVGEHLEERVRQVNRDLVPRFREVCRRYGLPADLEIEVPELHDVVFAEFAEAVQAPLSKIRDQESNPPAAAPSGPPPLRGPVVVFPNKFERGVQHVQNAVVGAQILGLIGGIVWDWNQGRKARRDLRAAILSVQLTPQSRQAILARVRTAVAKPLEDKAGEVERALA